MSGPSRPVSDANRSPSADAPCIGRAGGASGVDAIDVSDGSSKSSAVGVAGSSKSTADGSSRSTAVRLWLSVASGSNDVGRSSRRSSGCVASAAPRGGVPGREAVDGAGARAPSACAERAPFSVARGPGGGSVNGDGIVGPPSGPRSDSLNAPVGLRGGETVRTAAIAASMSETVKSVSIGGGYLCVRGATRERSGAGAEVSDGAAWPGRTSVRVAGRGAIRVPASSGARLLGTPAIVASPGGATWIVFPLHHGDPSSDRCSRAYRHVIHAAASSASTATAISSHSSRSDDVCCSSVALRAASAAVCARNAAICSPSDLTCACSASCGGRVAGSAGVVARPGGTDAPVGGVDAFDATDVDGRFGDGAGPATFAGADAGTAADVATGADAAGEVARGGAGAGSGTVAAGAGAAGVAGGPAAAGDDGAASVGVTLRRSPVRARGVDGTVAARTGDDDRAAVAGLDARRLGFGGAMRGRGATEASLAIDGADDRRAAGASRRGTVGCTTLRGVDPTTACDGGSAGGSSRKTNSRATGEVHPIDTTRPTAGSSTGRALVTSMRVSPSARTTRLRVCSGGDPSSARRRTCTQLTSSSGPATTGTEKRSGSPMPESSAAVPRPIAVASVATSAAANANSPTISVGRLGLTPPNRRREAASVPASCRDGRSSRAARDRPDPMSPPCDATVNFPPARSLRFDARTRIRDGFCRKGPTVHSVASCDRPAAAGGRAGNAAQNASDAPLFASARPMISCWICDVPS